MKLIENSTKSPTPILVFLLQASNQNWACSATSPWLKTFKKYKKVKWQIKLVPIEIHSLYISYHLQKCQNKQQQIKKNQPEKQTTKKNPKLLACGINSSGPKMY